MVIKTKEGLPQWRETITHGLRRYQFKKPQYYLPNRYASKNPQRRRKIQILLQYCRMYPTRFRSISMPLRSFARSWKKEKTWLGKLWCIRLMNREISFSTILVVLGIESNESLQRELSRLAFIHQHPSILRHQSRKKRPGNQLSIG
ncbi:hypothetical protein PGTUg99_033667 [Puccinia graminis f. sp. tritici]|uniref:Uncharacterized protein n=1 Tax=Puccinia graminis f. sp. tritici TaxID=56615 RepID=A0A5B0QS98_PUCGR|nr:hypothetical protein PGTUg99_033667 [Puccinia graminis f. sp. tritici]